jgi:hypothetical protein
MTNFVRYLAGLPSELELEQSLIDQAQYGALLLAATDELTHEPGKPVQMSRDMYDVGYRSTTTSNISVGVDTLSEQVLGFMDDLGLHNLKHVGHRRWILNPPLKKTGFGLAYASETAPYGAMQVFDTSDASAVKVDYEYIAWPAAGWFPSGFFAEEAAWSIAPNPQFYDLNQSPNLSIELTNERTNAKWYLDSNDYQEREKGEFFHVSLSEGGYPSALVFRPSDAVYNDASTYNVVVKGLYHREKGEVELTYQVRFFSLEDWSKPKGWSEDRVVITTDEQSVVEQSVTEAVNQLSDTITEFDIPDSSKIPVWLWVLIGIIAIFFLLIVIIRKII